MDAIGHYSRALIGAQTEAEVEDIANRALMEVSGANRVKFMRPKNGEIVTVSCVSGQGNGPHQQQPMIDGIIETAYSTNESRLIDDLTDTRSVTSASTDDTPQYRSLLC